MSENELNNRLNINKLNSEISSLKEERERLLKEMEYFIQERNKYNEEFKKKIDTVKEPKEKRNKLNARVQELKIERDKARAESSAKRNEIREIVNQLSQFKMMPIRSRDIAFELEDLEWKMQTSIMKTNEEKIMISKIAELERDLKIQQKSEALRSKLKTLRMRVNELDSNAESLHQELLRLVEESELYHNKIIKTSDESSNIKIKADEAHKKFIEVKTILKDINDSYVAALATLKSHRKNEIEGRKREEEAKLKEFKKNVEETATKKLEKKEKLSFEEFKILIERGMI